MSNNRGNITLARQIALRDIAKYMEERLKSKQIVIGLVLILLLQVNYGNVEK